MIFINKKNYKNKRYLFYNNIVDLPLFLLNDRSLYDIIALYD